MSDQNITEPKVKFQPSNLVDLKCLEVYPDFFEGKCLYTNEVGPSMCAFIVTKPKVPKAKRNVIERGGHELRYEVVDCSLSQRKQKNRDVEITPRRLIIFNINT